MNCPTCNGYGTYCHLPENEVCEECSDCNGTGEQPDPTAAPTTGAEAHAVAIARADWESHQAMPWDATDSYCQRYVQFATHYLTHVTGAGFVIVPATAATDADAIRRLLEISQLAQGLLLMHGAFGQPWQDNDLGNRLTAALEAITLPHDWERLTAWLAQQEGHLADDAARTEEGE